MAKVNTFNIPYPDFKLLDVIDPDQFDANNEEIVKKVNEVIENMLNADGDFLGTWHGLTPGEVAEAINGGRLDVIEPIVQEVKTAMADLKKSVDDDKAITETAIADLKRVSKNTQQEVANLNLYTDVNNRVKSGYTFGTNFETQFGMEVDWTKTEATSNLVATQTIVPVLSADGFKVGQEITIYDDVNLERVKIKAISGTSLTLESGLTKEFKMGANVARTMFDKNSWNEAEFGAWQSTKKDKYAYFNFPYADINNYIRSSAVRAYANFPSGNYINGLNTMSFDMDVMIPDVETSFPNANTSSRSEYSPCLFALGSAIDSGFRFGVTFEGYKGANGAIRDYDDMVRIENYSYIKNSQYTFWFSICRPISSGMVGHLLIAPEFSFKEFVGKHINIKIKVNRSLFVNSPSSSVELYVNGKRISLDVATLYNNSSPMVPVPGVFANLLQLMCGYSSGSSPTGYNSQTYGYCSKFIAYKDLNYGVKAVEYLFNGDFIGNSPQFTSPDSSGNDMNLIISYYGSGASMYHAGRMEKIAPVGKGIDESDLRFIPTKDSKEVGAWVTRSDKLIPVEGSYNTEPMTLSSLDQEDQYIANREDSKPADVRLTYKKTTDSHFPSITKIIGGVM